MVSSSKYQPHLGDSGVAMGRATTRETEGQRVDHLHHSSS